jgi:hypothetical protein
MRHACDVAVRSIKTGNQSKFYRIASQRENNWNCLSRPLSSERRRQATRGHNHRHTAGNEIGGECWQPIILALRPAVDDCDIFGLDKPGFF